MRIAVLIVVRGCTAMTTLFFKVAKGSHLLTVQVESELVADCIFQRVRVLGVYRRVWHTHPAPNNAASDP